jgi:hypothetical protein
LAAKLELDFALFEGAFADGESGRNADEVGVAKLFAGAGRAVVEEDAETCLG